jgi:AraC-like DNA-binding protein
MRPDDSGGDHRRPIPTFPRICALLGPRERTQVEAATEGRLTMMPRATVRGIYDDIANGHADGALLSVAMLRECDVPTVLAILRDLPATPVLGLLSEDAATATVPGTLLLGRAGVTRLVDIRERTGWTVLRDAFTVDLPESATRSALATIIAAIEVEPDGTRTRCSEGLRRFLTSLFSPDATTARGIAAALGLLPSTLTSRFLRAGLPSPKQYLALAKLLRAAYLGEAPGLAIRAIAERLQVSSAQSYGRMVRHMTGMTAGEFRRAVNGAAALERFTAAVVLPYRDKLRRFDPLRVARSVPECVRAGRAA